MATLWSKLGCLRHQDLERPLRAALKRPQPTRELLNGWCRWLQSFALRNHVSAPSLDPTTKNWRAAVQRLLPVVAVASRCGFFRSGHPGARALDDPTAGFIRAADICTAVHRYGILKFCLV